jgi:hypothetical protein
MSGIRSITRRPAIVGSASAASAPIYVDSDDNVLKIVPAGSGTTEVQVVDASSTQTLTNKTLTTPTIDTITAASAAHLVLNTTSDDKQPRLNSRSFAQTSGSSIGFQAKPAQNVASTGSVIGAEISPRANSGIAVANVIGLHVDAYLKGTAAGTISGDVRGQQIELVSDDAGTRDIGGNVSGLRIRMAFSAGTVTGKIAAIRVEKPETQTNSETYDALFELTSTAADCWNDDPTTELNLPGGTV